MEYQIVVTPSYFDYREYLLVADPTKHAPEHHDESVIIIDETPRFLVEERKRREKKLRMEAAKAMISLSRQKVY